MAVTKNRNVIWKPHKGSQQLFLTCPADEILLHGNRGGGKTDCLIMDFLQHVGAGYGSDWRGIIFRQEYTQLIDVINKCNKWIPQIFPGAKYNGSEHKWTFTTGESLYLRNLPRPESYHGYHGWEIPWLGFEELTNWPTDECYKLMLSTNRSSNGNVPLKIRATTNPSGPGHAWVKLYFIDVAPALKIHTDIDTQRTRVHIPSRLEENETLLKSNPNYANTIAQATKDDPVKYKAWVLGEWDIVVGGALTDVWDTHKQVLPVFEIPTSWKIVRSFDWGSAKPWAVTYGVECNGEQPSSMYELPYFPAGSVIIIDEIYGWDGTPNTGDRATSQEIAERVLAKDAALQKEFGCRVIPGPADTSIWEVRDGSSIAQNLNSHGCSWRKAYKGSGSRVAGLSAIRQMLSASKRGDLEKPGLYFTERARHHIRTFPLLQYDEKKYEDVDTDQEDHCYDSTRYLLTRKLTTIKHRKVRF